MTLSTLLSLPTSTRDILCGQKFGMADLGDNSSLKDGGLVILGGYCWWASVATVSSSCFTIFLIDGYDIWVSLL